MDRSRIVASYQLPFSFNVLSKLPQGQTNPRRAGMKRNRRHMEDSEGIPLEVTQRSVRPRLDDSSQSDPSTNVHVDNSGHLRDCSPSSVPPLTPLSLLASDIPPSSESLKAIDAPDQASSPPGTNGEPAPVLTEVNPESGPITGGTRVWLKGMDFPTTSPLFARFGSAVVPTVRPYYCLRGLSHPIS